MDKMANEAAKKFSIQDEQDERIESMVKGEINKKHKINLVEKMKLLKSKDLDSMMGEAEEDDSQNQESVLEAFRKGHADIKEQKAPSVPKKEAPAKPAAKPAAISTKAPA